MDEIILRQRDAAKPLTGKTFLLGIALIVLKLSIAQMVLHLMISAAGAEFLSIVFYLYAVWLLLGFLRRTVACYVYTLTENTLVLERRLGDSLIRVIEIPLESVISLRAVKKGESLRTTYQSIAVIDPACRAPFRVRAAFVLSLLSARLARFCAGVGIDEEIAYVLVYSRAERQKACVFRPDDEMCEKLAQMLGGAYGFDERMTRARVTTLYARALQRAFPALYPYVDPLVREDEAEWAKAELERRKTERKQKKAGGGRRTGAGKSEKTEKKENAAEPQSVPQKKRRRKQG